MAHFDHPVMDLPASYYSAVGEFMFRFAQLEYQLHEIIWMAMDLGYQQGRILTIGTDFRVLSATIKTITRPDARVWVKNKTIIQEMNSIVGNGRKHYGLRNKIAHGSWQSPDGSPKNARLHFMKQEDERILPRHDKTLNDQRIHRHAGELRTLNHRAKKLIEQLYAGRPIPPVRSA